MTNPAISTEAIEAATRRLAAENGWEGPYPEGLARAALEAAAPHMLAGAWDEGYTTGNAHNGRRDANPHRTKP